MIALANLVIRDAHPHDHPAAAEVLAAAFGDSPVVGWAQPNPAARAAQLGFYFTALLRHTGVHGTIRLATADTRIVGVALWYRHTAGETGLHDLLPANGDSGVPESLHRLARLEHLLRKRRPVEPHHYLAYLGVATGEQNRGIGTTLVSEYHDTLSAAGMPAYLEANDPRNRALYARLGYADHGAAITGHGGPPVYPMRWTPGR
ncbi:GNAT family N-acetyltransferase [Actinoplanes sp. Pm04-4]|uniref:GNAT family N-acetyltransferase n=1 Tax=Paractinoplanes pyxinae TaxID=2997416 RepID=A0ABT4B4S2_9ACTN|nr:GNAT family N-acetyltransferase [Actinoplanes pyxinae]MCY1141481.1 GNAT family N-acetyltransferase [Actinoplanes pyxinae]